MNKSRGRMIIESFIEERLVDPDTFTEHGEVTVRFLDFSVVTLDRENCFDYVLNSPENDIHDMRFHQPWDLMDFIMSSLVESSLLIDSLDFSISADPDVSPIDNGDIQWTEEEIFGN